MIAGARPKRDIVSHGEYQGVHRGRQVDIAKKLFGAMGIARDDKPDAAGLGAQGLSAVRRAGLAGADLRQDPRPRCGLPLDPRRALLRHRAGRVGSGLGTVINGQGIARSDIVREEAGIPEDEVIMTCVAMDIRTTASPPTL